jgi:hypothetical protein
VFITKSEVSYFSMSTFLSGADIRLRYENLSSRVKNVGYGGITQLNQEHLKKVVTGQGQVESYLKLVKGHSNRSVMNLLRILFIMC